MRGALYHRVKKLGIGQILEESAVLKVDLLGIYDRILNQTGAVQILVMHADPGNLL